MCTDIHHRLMDAVRRKCPPKWRTNQWFHLHKNAAAYWLILVKYFLSKNNMTTLEHSPYSSNLTAADFHLFPWLKSEKLIVDYQDVFETKGCEHGRAEKVPQDRYWRRLIHLPASMQTPFSEANRWISCWRTWRTKEWLRSQTVLGHRLWCSSGRKTAAFTSA